MVCRNLLVQHYRQKHPKRSLVIGKKLRFTAGKTGVLLVVALSAPLRIVHADLDEVAFSWRELDHSLEVLIYLALSLKDPVACVSLSAFDQPCWINMDRDTLAAVIHNLTWIFAVSCVQYMLLSIPLLF